MELEADNLGTILVFFYWGTSERVQIQQNFSAIYLLNFDVCDFIEDSLISIFPNKTVRIQRSFRVFRCDSISRFGV